ncbi:MAG TPA: hypothetical protein VN784_08195 [Candidatus Limnocylindrales bacterium]|nr:hypothetical protein [Candidatus Limnocylindrales bacterium]
MNVLDKILDAVKPTPPKTNPVEAAAEVVVQLAEKRIKNAMGSRLGEAKILYAKGRQIQKRINTELSSHGATLAFEEQQRQHGEAVDSDNLANITRGRSLADWEIDFASRRAAAGLAAQKIWKQFRCYESEISDLLLQELHQQIFELEKMEAANAQKFGLLYSSSSTIITLRSVSDWLKNRGADTLMEKN